MRWVESVLFLALLHLGVALTLLLVILLLLLRCVDLQWPPGSGVGRRLLLKRLTLLVLLAVMYTGRKRMRQRNRSRRHRQVLLQELLRRGKRRESARCHRLR